MPLYITAVGGMISSVFVILMVLSLDIAGGDSSRGVHILYGTMSAAYLTAELWLGAFASLLALILPARTKTFCLALYTSTVILIYSAGPEIVGLALSKYEVGSDAYLARTRSILATLIPVGYWVAGVGFLCALSKVRADVGAQMVEVGQISLRRKLGFITFGVILGSLTIALFVASLVLSSSNA